MIQNIGLGGVNIFSDLVRMFCGIFLITALGGLMAGCVVVSVYVLFIFPSMGMQWLIEKIKSCKRGRE